MAMHTTTSKAPARNWLRSAWLHPFNDTAALDDLLGLVNPLWSLAEIRARVIEVIDETADTRSLVLQPNARWPGFAAGQYVPVFIEIDGVRQQRCYSLSSAPQAQTLRITIKRQPGGRVSNALHRQIKVGDVLTLGQPAGDFTLPLDPPAGLLLVGAGSGMTPLMAQVQQLNANGYAGEVQLVQLCRTESDVLFGDELRALAAAWPALKVSLHLSSQAGRLSAAQLMALVPDYAQRHTLLCGPVAYMEELRTAWQAQQLGHRLQTEAFSLAIPKVVAEGATADVRCTRSEQVFTAAPGQPLLSEAEGAGLRPRSGCRIGICHSCKCIKRSGSVQNLLTGEISDAPDEAIQLCISAARSDLTLDL
jgi:ferredoxin-NADP reductase